MIGDWQGCTPCVLGCEKRRVVKCVRPVGHAEQDVDVIADSYCQGPKPKEGESCSNRRRRDDVLTREEKNKSMSHAVHIAKDCLFNWSWDIVRSDDNEVSWVERV